MDSNFSMACSTAVSILCFSMPFNTVWAMTQHQSAFAFGILLRASWHSLRSFSASIVDPMIEWQAARQDFETAAPLGDLIWFAFSVAREIVRMASTIYPRGIK